MMMLYPYLTIGLLAAAALAAALVFSQGEGKLGAFFHPGNETVWSQGRSWGQLLARYGEGGLLTAALCLLAFALSRPQKVRNEARGLGSGIDIMMAVDTSLSMSALDFSPESRLDAAKETASQFIEGRTQDRIGAIVFGGAPQLACPLTSDYTALLGEIKDFYPGMTHTDGTAIGDAIVSAVNHIKDGSAKSKIIVLLTDGRSNTGVIDPITAAKIAQTYGIKIYTIGTAKRGQSMMPIDDPSRGRVMVPIDDDLDDDLLTQVAEMTGGQYFRVTNLKASATSTRPLTGSKNPK
jgi:Ca-activated chloride channel family protein